VSGNTCRSPGVYAWGVITEAFQTLGYEPCGDADLEPDVEKVAVYADDNGSPTHAARQLVTGAWTSKLGREEDLEHQKLAGVEGEEYGHVVQVMRRPRQIPP